MILLDSPVLSMSGYGARGRELARALISARDDVRVSHRGWGSTREISASEVDFSVSDVPEQVGTYIYHGQPQSFRPRVPADHFVFCTAGTEVDRIGLDSVRALNHADEVWVSSEFSKTVFEQSAYRVRGQEFEVEPPVKVVPEVPGVRGAETELSREVEDELSGQPAVLAAGTWTDFRPGVGRKAITELISVFNATFESREDRPALLLKTDAGSLSAEARASVRERAQELIGDADLVLVQGALTREEMNSLYTSDAVEGYFSLTRGEGFGRTIMEASKAGLPVLAPGYTGQLDFLDEERQLVVGGSPTQVPVEKIGYTSYPEGSRWMAPNMPFAHQALFTLHAKNDELQEQAGELAEELREEYTVENLANKIDNLLP